MLTFKTRYTDTSIKSQEKHALENSYWILSRLELDARTSALL